MTSIEWHGETWNPAKRLDLPLRWRKPRMVFVNSMSDLFDDQLDQIFAVMALTPHHTYQVLMNRPGRMLEYFAGDSGNRITSLMLAIPQLFGS